MPGLTGHLADLNSYHCVNIRPYRVDPGPGKPFHHQDAQVRIGQELGFYLFLSYDVFELHAVVSFFCFFVVVS